VAVAGAVSVDVVVVVVDSVPIVPVEVAVVVAVVEVSSTTAGACAAGALSGAAASFFWQPVASASVVAAAKPRIRNFFISLYSFFLKKRVLLESAAETLLRKSTRNDIRSPTTVKEESTPGHVALDRARACDYPWRSGRAGASAQTRLTEVTRCSRASASGCRAFSRSSGARGT
jgi:hypothetical protein